MTHTRARSSAQTYQKYCVVLCTWSYASLVPLPCRQAHHDSKHPKLPWDPSLYEDVQAKYGATTKGVAVRGTTNAKKLKVCMCVLVHACRENPLVSHPCASQKHAVVSTMMDGCAVALVVFALDGLANREVAPVSHRCFPKTPSTVDRSAFPSRPTLGGSAPFGFAWL